MSKLVRLRESGLMTIPVEYQTELGVEDDSLFYVWVEGGELRLRLLTETETADYEAGEAADERGEHGGAEAARPGDGR